MFPTKADPFLYINMGGEMIYVLHHRLKAQKIAVDKSIRVLDEVCGAVLDPTIISSLFQESATSTAATTTTTIDLLAIRSKLEKAVLSSIMTLDESSMNKLFDLMIMMVKYQINAATGPRELILITLNHLDFMRDAIMDPNFHDNLEIIHRMLLQNYGNLTNEEMWKIREISLNQLENYNVRVCVLLRLGLQNEDGSFNAEGTRKYDERYKESVDESAKIKVSDDFIGERGSLNLIGKRITNLGRNIYSSSYGLIEGKDEARDNFDDEDQGKRSILDKRGKQRKEGTRAELGMLATQLGNDRVNDDLPREKLRPFTLELFTKIVDKVDNEKNENTEKESGETEDVKLSPVRDDRERSNDEYRAKLDDIYTELMIADEEKIKINETEIGRDRISGRFKLLDLMDQLE